MKQAGFRRVSRRTPRLPQALPGAQGEEPAPPGFALGNATADGNVWCLGWCGRTADKMVDNKGNVVISSPETEAALNYGKQLYETFIRGTLSWLDPNNNKAFLDGQIGMTTNGISVYYAAKNSQDRRSRR
jgi:multiple sugar transport system substrate-binding protein